LGKKGRSKAELESYSCFWGVSCAFRFDLQVSSSVSRVIQSIVVFLTYLWLMARFRCSLVIYLQIRCKLGNSSKNQAVSRFHCTAMPVSAKPKNLLQSCQNQGGVSGGFRGAHRKCRMYRILEGGVSGGAPDPPPSKPKCH